MREIKTRSHSLWPLFLCGYESGYSSVFNGSKKLGGGVPPHRCERCSRLWGGCSSRCVFAGGQREAEAFEGDLKQEPALLG